MAKKAKPKAGADKPEPKLEKRNIDDLQPHEKQADYFADLSEEELERLTDSIRRNGLKTPPDILSDGRIIAGHQRVIACRRLEWSEIDVRVRYDLEGDDEAIEYELISDNFDRRQLSPIEIARAYRRLKEIEKGRPRSRGDGESTGDLRDRLAAKYEMTGRYLDMLDKVLDTPEAIQRAVLQKHLGITKAMKVAALDQQVQRELAADISTLIRDSASELDMLPGRIKRLVGQYLRDHLPRSKKVKKPDGDVKRFVQDVERAIGDLAQELNRRPRLKLTVSLPKLQGARDRLDQIVQQAESRSAT